MTWVSIILYVITHIPDLIVIIKKVIDLIKGMPKPQQGAIREMFSDAIDYHKQTKDASKVRRVCVGIGCAPELVGE